MSDLHGKIMNIQADHTASNADYKSKREAYIFGHRDARHAAAELATTHAGAAAEPNDWLAANNSPLHRQLCMKPDACSECDRIAALTSAPAAAFTFSSEQVEDAAIAIAACMEYPWKHMPELGRDNMRRHAKAVIEAAFVRAPAEAPPAAGAIDARVNADFSPMYLAPLDGTPVLLHMPTTGDKFAIGQWHGPSDSITGNWGDDEGNFFVHQPTGFMSLRVLERLASGAATETRATGIHPTAKTMLDDMNGEIEG